MNIKIAICDDREQFVEQINVLCKNYSEKKEIDIDIACFTDPKVLLKSTEVKRYDIFLLDVEMPGMDGIELGTTIKNQNENAIFIFITIHNNYAFKASQIDPLGFLVKPAKEAQFTRLMDRALLVFKGIQEQMALDNQYITIVEGYKKLQLHVKEIVVMEKLVNSVILTTKTGEEYKYYTTIKSLEEKLNKKRFTKISSGCIVNMEYIKSITASVVSVQIGESEKFFTIGRTAHKEVKNEIKRYLARKALMDKK